MRRMVPVLACLLLVFAGAARGGELADPKPDWDHPRKLVLQMDSNDLKKVNAILTYATNTQNFYGPDNVKVAVVAFGPGVHSMIKAESKVAHRVASLSYTGVEFMACGSTLETLHKTAADLLPGVTVTPAGVPELMERQLKGWVYVAP